LDLVTTPERRTTTLATKTVTAERLFQIRGHLPMPIFVSDGITKQDPNGFDSSMLRMVWEVSVKGGSDYDNQEVITVKFVDGFRSRVFRPDEMVQIYMLILGDDLTPDQPIE
jgi:hypothetical protein